MVARLVGWLVGLLFGWLVRPERSVGLSYKKRQEFTLEHAASIGALVKTVHHTCKVTGSLFDLGMEDLLNCR